jgi:hypothetical protein
MATKSQTGQSQKKRTEANTCAFPLAEEVKTYEAHLAEWASSS